MNELHQGLILLIKSAVLEQPFALPEGFNLEAAAGLIKKHNILTLAYDGALRCGISAQNTVMRTFFQGYCRAMQTSERQMSAFARLCSAFDEHGIDYMPLKGVNLKGLYAKPELRPMGDADVLIRMEQYEIIIPIMQSLGYTADGETDHELPWRSSELYLELHKCLIPSYNRDYYAYFGDGWQRAVRQSGTRYAMSGEDSFVYLFTHFAKHFRDGGIGCRHVVDLWQYRRKNPDLDEAYIRRELDKLQLLEFYGNTCRLISAWFDNGPRDDRTEFMSEFIFASGSWGSMESRVVSAVVRDAEYSGVHFSGKLVYLLQVLFPPLVVLRSKYTVLQKYPWMLPFVWVVRPFYKLLFELRSLGKRKAQLDAVSREKLLQRRQVLKNLGLTYRE